MGLAGAVYVENKMENTAIRFPDWDYGTTANKKLNDLCKTQGQKDLLCEYLTQEMPVDELVWHLLRYTPKDVLKQIAIDIGTYELEEEEGSAV